ncbi:Metallophos domain containing protein [Asbolus verrucosus]|uniref:Metallophos domain containing protein n=1 Tax=Asbolus verrucosus TaxID=1661398 RepID=A0A482VZV1_ASBVE|nr:Metallophos domain containing protein [Asbolus verrucosus]
MDNNIIKVHPLTDTPTEAWIEISKKQQFIPLKIQNPTTPITPDKVRIVCMSDTHSENIKFDIPDGDIFIHAGDFTRCGFRVEIIAFNEWLKSLPHRHKIVICGNHELSFDENCDILDFKEDISAGIKTDLREYLTNCIYLQDAEITLFGIKFYGTPWQVVGICFQMEEGEAALNCCRQYNNELSLNIIFLDISMRDMECLQMEPPYT